MIPDRGEQLTCWKAGLLSRGTTTGQRNSPTGGNSRANTKSFPWNRTPSNRTGWVQISRKQLWRKGSGDPGRQEEPSFSLAKANCFPWTVLFPSIQYLQVWTVSSSGLPRLSQTQTHWRTSGGDHQPDQGPEHTMHNGRMQDLSSFSPEKRRGRRDLIALCSHLTGSCGEDRWRSPEAGREATAQVGTHEILTCY